MSTLYERRVEQEWRLLQALKQLNPEFICDCARCEEGGIEVFHFTLRQTQALIEQGEELQIIDEHRVRVHFPRFFPTVPVEVSLHLPVFHPNVHPETGFVCLWDRSSPENTMSEAIVQLQRVVTWELCNKTPTHVMQPRTLLRNRDLQPADGACLWHCVLRKPNAAGYPGIMPITYSATLRRRLQ
jgi:Ubiquitin-conjugating enzyme